MPSEILINIVAEPSSISLGAFPYNLFFDKSKLIQLGKPPGYSVSTPASLIIDF